MSDLFLLNPKSEINDNTEIGFIPMACVDDGFSGKHSFEIRNWGDVKKGYCHFKMEILVSQKSHHALKI